MGEDIYVRVLDTGRSRVKLGIEAPPDVSVVRVELPPLEDDARAQEKAAKASGPVRRD